MYRENNKLAEPPPISSAVSKRFTLYAAADFSGVTVWKATTKKDWSDVEKLRKNGFDRKGRKNCEWVDDSDHSHETLVLLATKDSSIPIATMKIQNGTNSDLDLEEHVNLDYFIFESERPLVQFSRLSVNRGDDAISVMFALFKSAWLWCFINNLESIVISSPPWAKAIYQFMAFRDFGSAGEFTHPLLPNVIHATMLLPVQRAEQVWRGAEVPLCEQLWEREHPDIEFWR